VSELDSPRERVAVSLKMFKPSPMFDSYRNPSYQYVDQARVTSEQNGVPGGTGFGGGSLQPTVVALRRSVNLTTHVPA
jgi:hypothetical protein